MLNAHGERKENALPILCVENGMVILRLSEIFGVHQSLKRSVKGGNYHSSSFKGTVALGLTNPKVSLHLSLFYDLTKMLVICFLTA